MCRKFYYFLLLLPSRIIITTTPRGLEISGLCLVGLMNRTIRLVLFDSRPSGGIFNKITPWWLRTKKKRKKKAKCLQTKTYTGSTRAAPLRKGPVWGRKSVTETNSSTNNETPSHQNRIISNLDPDDLM